MPRRDQRAHLFLIQTYLSPSCLLKMRATSRLMVVSAVQDPHRRCAADSARFPWRRRCDGHLIYRPSLRCLPACDGCLLSWESARPPLIAATRHRRTAPDPNDVTRRLTRLLGDARRLARCVRRALFRQDSCRADDATVGLHFAFLIGCHLCGRGRADSRTTARIERVSRRRRFGSC